MAKIFFFDVDGTIVDSSRKMHLISEKTKYAIRELSKNNYVFISSGRCEAMMEKQILDLNPNGFVLCNGAFVKIEDKKIFSKSFSDDALSAIKRVTLENNGFYCLEANDKVYVNDKNDPVFSGFTSSWETTMDYIVNDDGEKRDIYIAMIGFGNKEVLDSVYDQLIDYVELDRHFWFTSYDINVKGINKGVGCKKAMEYLNIPLEDSYAFGDGLNDLQMLETVGHPVIMDNCMKQLRNRGFEETLDVLDDGVYDYLVKNHLIEPVE